MAPGKVFERNKRTQSIRKDRGTIQKPQILFDGSNQTQEDETQQVLAELNRTQEHELQQIHNAPNQAHDDIDPDTTNVNSESISISQKRIRGPSRGKGLENLIKGGNKLLVEIPEGKGRPIDAVQSAKLSSEIGIISRQFTPIPTKWKDMKDNYKAHALERLKRRCEINARVRRNVKLPHNQGSRAFVASRYAMRNDDQEPNRMDFFKATHYSNGKGWTSSNAQTTYEKMVELQSTPVEEGSEPKTTDDIVDEVLGTRSGYIPGLGYGPKPKKKIKCKYNRFIKEFEE
ncbi:hypothetical protein V6N11_066211 [Hibiscus sabdariffa]|uniref:Uncharacterized protein n=1 Tax=Hibiscus sabdariffa TaxID=183260 RepID=A0ABR2A5J0_9ROSI